MLHDSHPSRTCECFACSLRAAQMNAIRCLPLDVLPSGSARTALEVLAAAGVAVRVAPGKGTARDWTIRIGKCEALSAKMWRLAWAQLCEWAGLSGYVAGVMGADEFGEH